MSTSSWRAVAAAAVAALAGAYALRRISRPRPVTSLALSCACGRVRGALRPASPLRLVCYCDDCQAYAAWLRARMGCSVTVDEHGGQEFLQCFRADVELERGCAALLHATVLKQPSPTGLVRLHATCCGAPLFCLFGPPALPLAQPHVSVCLSALPELRTEAERAATLGPLAARLNARFATNKPLDPNYHPKPVGGFSPLFLATFVCRQLWFRARRAPDPFKGVDEIVILRSTVPT